MQIHICASWKCVSLSKKCVCILDFMNLLQMYRGERRKERDWREIIERTWVSLVRSEFSKRLNWTHTHLQLMYSNVFWLFRVNKHKLCFAFYLNTPIESSSANGTVSGNPCFSSKMVSFINFLQLSNTVTSFGPVFTDSCWCLFPVCIQFLIQSPCCLPYQCSVTAQPLKGLSLGFCWCFPLIHRFSGL